MKYCSIVGLLSIGHTGHFCEASISVIDSFLILVQNSYTWECHISFLGSGWFHHQPIIRPHIMKEYICNGSDSAQQDRLQSLDWTGKLDWWTALMD